MAFYSGWHVPTGYLDIYFVSQYVYFMTERGILEDLGKV